MAVRREGVRTSRLVALRRFRDDRNKMAEDAAADRAVAVEQIATAVTDIVIAARKDLEELAAARSEMSSDVRDALSAYAEKRAAETAKRHEATAAYRAALRKEVAAIVSADFR